MSGVLERAFDIAEKSHWQIKTLGDVCRTSSGGTPSRSRPDYFNGKIPWVKSGELTDGLVSEVSEFISEEALAGSSAKLLPAGTLLIAMYGATVGKLGVLARAAATNQAVCAIFPPPELDPKFLFWYLRRQRSNLIAKAVGGAQPNISQTILRDLELPIPPPGEQREIVAEIEKQFSRLDEAVANLQRVKANLKRYKASVLKAAVEGRLVETEATLAGREGRTFETGEQLLQRILDERQAKWSGRGKWKAPEAPTTDAPLPDGWAWASVDQLADVGTGATPKRDKAAYWNDGDVPWVTSSVVNGDYVDEASEFVTKLALAETNLTLYPIGTLLIAMYGEGKTRGKCTELRIPAATNQALAALLVDTSIRGYLRHFLELNYEEMRKVASGGVQPNLNLSLVRAVCVPLPPLPEQVRIVAEVDRHLSIVREVEALVEINLRRSQATRQGILATAFGQTRANEITELKPKGMLAMKNKKLPVLPSPRKSEVEDDRKNLLAILQQHPGGLTAEQLFQEAGYRGDQVDQFYRDLSAVSKKVDKSLAVGDATNWPFGSSVRLNLI